MFKGAGYQAGYKADRKRYSEGRIDGDVLFSWQCYAPRKQFADPVDRASLL